MITNKLARDTLYVELEGKTTDTKPTENIGANSKFFELDTGDEYYFDEDDWSKVGAENQGGE